MDFIEGLAQELIARLVPRITAAVVAEVVAQIKQEEIYRYSEEEAAALLGISHAALVQLRKEKQIEFTYSLMPTLGADGKLHGGRVSYLPRHIDEYLARNEQKIFFGNLRAAA